MPLVKDGWTEGKKFDDGKVRMELIPPSTYESIGAVLTFGAKKYADRNWEKGIKWSRCYGAAMRHLAAWWGGENLDPETKFSHLWHAQCCLSFLVEYLRTHPELDDRPRPPENRKETYLDMARWDPSGRIAPPSSHSLAGLSDATGFREESESV